MKLMWLPLVMVLIAPLALADNRDAIRVSDKLAKETDILHDEIKEHRHFGELKNETAKLEKAARAVENELRGKDRRNEVKEKAEHLFDEMRRVRGDFSKIHGKFPDKKVMEAWDKTEKLAHELFKELHSHHGGDDFKRFHEHYYKK